MKKGEIRLLILGLVSFFLTVICTIVAVCLMVGAVAKEAGDKDIGGKISQGIQSMSEKVWDEDALDTEIDF